MPDAVMNGAMRTNARMYFIMASSLSLSKEITESGKRHEGDQTIGSAMLMLIGFSALIGWARFSMNPLALPTALHASS